MVCSRLSGIESVGLTCDRVRASTDVDGDMIGITWYARSISEDGCFCEAVLCRTSCVLRSVESPGVIYSMLLDSHAYALSSLE